MNGASPREFATSRRVFRSSVDAYSLGEISVLAVPTSRPLNLLERGMSTPGAETAPDGEVATAYPYRALTSGGGLPSGDVHGLAIGPPTVAGRGQGSSNRNVIQRDR